MDDDRARRLLADERERVEGSLARYRADLTQAPEEMTTVDQHQADAASDLYDREDAEGRIAELEEHLEAVARAEQRLADGTFGVSVDSGEPIHEARLQALPAAERTAEEEESRERGGDAVPGDEGDDETPLDEPAPPPPDLASIPMRSSAPASGVAAAEVDDDVDLPIAGEAYEGEGGAPRVGRDEPDDDAVERLYRPER